MFFRACLAPGLEMLLEGRVFDPGEKGEAFPVGRFFFEEGEEKMSVPQYR